QDVRGGRAERIAALGLVQVPQGDGLFGEMTVEENLMMGAFPAASWRDRRAGLTKIYERFPVVAERASQRARTLSGGERRLVALGRALMRPSRIMRARPSATMPRTKIGRAHIWTPVTDHNTMPASAFKKKRHPH